MAELKALKVQETVKDNGELKILHPETTVDQVVDLAVEAWATATKYAKNQFVTNDGSLYQAKTEHTAAATFVEDMASGAEKWTLIASAPSSGAGHKIFVAKDEPAEMNEGDIWFKVLD